MITRPVRERPADQVRTMVTEGLRRTGYDEVALTSLSTADFSGIEDVVGGDHGRPGAAATCRCRCRRLRVDAFTVGIAGQIQKARRTGLTFAPEAGTWRMRQVINKLIREEDLYGAVDSAYQPGLAADEALLPHRAAHRDRRGHARHRRRSPATASRSAGSTTRTRRSPCRSAGSCPSRSRRSSGSARTRARSCTARWTCCATSCAATGASSSSGTTRRPRWSRASPAAATAASAPVIEDVWRRGGTFQEWSEHFDLDLWLEALERPRAQPRGGTSTGTAPRTRCSRGTTSRPASTRTSSGRTGATRSPRSASRTAAGRPATTAAPAPATASSTWSPRPSRPPAAARAPARTSRPAARCPSPSRPGPWPARRRVLMRVRLRFAKLGKVRFTSHRDVARIWERALRRADAPGRLHARASRPGPSCTSGWPCRPAHESRAEYLDVDLRRRAHPTSRTCPSGSTPCCPRASTCTAAAPVEPGTPVAAAGGDELRLADRGADRRAPISRRRVERVLAADELVVTRERKGQVTATTSGPTCEDLRGRGTHRGGRRARRRLGTQPRGLRPAELVAALGAGEASEGPVFAPGRIIRTHQWMQRDGARQEPLPTATSAPHAEARAS